MTIPTRKRVAAAREFHQSLPDYAPTPLISLPEIAKELGIRLLLLKDETSRLGLPAFKILGASWATARAVSKRLQLGHESLNLQALKDHAQAADLTLYAATEGNHGRAVARMAKYLGIKARIFFPDSSDEAVRGNITKEGAEIVVLGGSYDQAVIATKAAAENHEDGKGLLISDTALEVKDETAQWIVDGYQTMFLEIEEQIAEFTTENITHILSPVGVGSLCQAVVTYYGNDRKLGSPHIITVEPVEAACLKASLEAGKMTSIEVGYTICTGMCCGTPSVSAWALLKDAVSMALTVEDRDVEEALLELHRYGVNGGPCGSAALAAVRQLDDLGQDAVVLLLCTEGARRYDMKRKN
jgi:diaminopropionate ammonia-lyase